MMKRWTTSFAAITAALSLGYAAPVSAGGNGYTVVLSKAAGGLLVEADTKFNMTVGFNSAQSGCGDNQQQPCIIVRPGAGLGDVSISESYPADCHLERPTDDYTILCLLTDYSGLAIKSNNASININDNGSGHTEYCFPFAVQMAMTGVANVAAYNGCKNQALTCFGKKTLISGTINVGDTVLGMCAPTGNSSILKK